MTQSTTNGTTKISTNVFMEDRNTFSEKDRLDSYQNWPLSLPKPEQLAKAGFLYTGKDDIVECVFCWVIIAQWKTEDDPMEEHKRWSSNCRFVRNLYCGNIPIINTDKMYHINTSNDMDYPQFSLFNSRLETYVNWPKRLKQKPVDLSKAGFFYSGKGDRVACFQCGGIIEYWEEVDVPWEQHIAAYSDCSYVKNHFTKEEIIKIQTKIFGELPDH